MPSPTRLRRFLACRRIFKTQHFFLATLTSYATQGHTGNMATSDAPLPDDVWKVIIDFREIAELVLASVDDTSSEYFVREAVDILVAAVGTDPFKLHGLTEVSHGKIVGSLRWKSIAVTFYMLIVISRH